MSQVQPEDVAKWVSRVCGWLYVLAWSLSFYPQPLLNIRRRSVQGLTPDFPMLNVVGFGSYALSTFIFLYSSAIREQYAARHPASPEPTVRFNDLAFGVHGFIMCCITFSQFWPRLWGWKSADRGRLRCTRLTMAVFYVGMGGVALTFVTVLISSNGKGSGADPEDWAWIDVVYSFTYVKLLLTVFKYVPQVMANSRRKSTVGWSINQILLDFTGGILSLVQLVLDSALQADWSGLTGNPVKFGLANISMLFDVIFMVQHYMLYGPVERATDDDDDDAEGGAGPRPSREYDPLLN